MSDGIDLRAEFLLDPSVTFLNHGSFGACPRAVFERYQAWQLEVERQPVHFLARRLETLLEDARATLGAYVGADPDDLVFVPNATAGINIAAWPLGLGPGDEVLSTDLEYGALDLAWEHVCRDLGARYVRTPIPLPIASADEVAETIWAGIGPRTRVLFLSHHTSSTALTLPVKELCRRARERGIRTVIDGAHVPGHLPLNLRALDPDYYAGNCHKWLCAPKGAGFLYVRRELQPDVHPLVISWGYEGDDPSFLSRHEKQGTRDPSAYLTVPRRSSGSASTTGTRSAAGATNWRDEPGTNWGSSRSRRIRPTSARWCRCGFRMMRARISRGASTTSAESRSRPSSTEAAGSSARPSRATTTSATSSG